MLNENGKKKVVKKVVYSLLNQSPDKKKKTCNGGTQLKCENVSNHSGFYWF